MDKFRSGDAPPQRGLHRIAEGADPIIAKAVANPNALLPGAHYPGFAKGAKMLGNGARRQWDPSRDLAATNLPLFQKNADDGNPSRVPHGGGKPCQGNLLFRESLQTFPSHWIVFLR